MHQHTRTRSRSRVRGGAPVISLLTLLFALHAAPVAAQLVPWQALDEGIAGDSAAEVLAVASYRGDLIAGGDFVFEGANNADGLARWDGTAWHDMGDVNVGTVESLLAHDGLLYVAGGFINAADGLERGVLIWDGNGWTVLDDDIDLLAVRAMTIYNNELVIAATIFDDPFQRHRVLRWDGTQWQQMGLNFNHRVTALCVFEGELIVGGSFSRHHLEDIRGIARWDGTTWQRLRDGLGVSGIGQAVRDVADLEVYQGDLIAAGAFSTAGGRMVRNIARWNGTEWRGLDGGADARIFGLTVYKNDLVAIGQFQRIGGINARCVARWQPAHGWRPLGTGFNAQGYCLTPWSEGLVAGGSFEKSGSRDVNFVALWPR